MSDTQTRFIYGVVVTEVPNMKEAYDEIAEWAGKQKDLVWRSDVLYGDEPSRIVVGVNASWTMSNFEQINFSILTERVENAEQEYNQYKKSLEQFLTSIGCKFEPAQLVIFNYED